jgi:hypothetical protein
VAAKAIRNIDNPRAAEPAACERSYSQLLPIVLTPQSAFELSYETISGEIGGTLPRDNDKIGGQRKRRPVTAKIFTDLTFDAVSDDRITDFAADSDPQPGLVLVIRPADDNEIYRLQLAAGTRQPQEFRSISQAGRFREPFRPFQRYLQATSYLRARLGGTDTVSLLRPLARRRLSTLRPPGDCIRARKP